MNSRIHCKRNKKAAGMLALGAVMLAGAFLCSSPYAFAAESPASCASNPQNRALDFWLGDWTIAVPGVTSNASSRVTLELDKCLVVEHWTGGRETGENLFGYNADDNSWHGLFANSDGRVHVFFNGKVAAGMAEFTGPSHGSKGETDLNRITIRRIGADRVEQVWQKSPDGGKTWNTVFHGDYTRKRS